MVMTTLPAGAKASPPVWFFHQSSLQGIAKRELRGLNVVARNYLQLSITVFEITVVNTTAALRSRVPFLCVTHVFRVEHFPRHLSSSTIVQGVAYNSTLVDLKFGHCGLQASWQASFPRLSAGAMQWIKGGYLRPFRRQVFLNK